MYMFWLSIYFSNFSPRPQEKRLEAQPFPPRSLHWRWLEIQKGLLGCSCFVVFGVFFYEKKSGYVQNERNEWKKNRFWEPLFETPDVYQFPPPGFPTLKTTCVLSAVLSCHSRTSMFQKERKRKVGLGDWQIFGFVSSFINVNKQHGTSTLGIARIAILFHIHPLHQVAQAAVSASSSRRFRNSSNRFWLDSDKLERSPFLGGEQNSG